MAWPRSTRGEITTIGAIRSSSPAMQRQPSPAIRACHEQCSCDTRDDAVAPEGLTGGARCTNIRSDQTFDIGAAAKLSSVAQSMRPPGRRQTLADAEEWKERLHRG